MRLCFLLGETTCLKKQIVSYGPSDHHAGQATWNTCLGRFRRMLCRGTLILCVACDVTQYRAVAMRLHKVYALRNRDFRKVPADRRSLNTWRLRLVDIILPVCDGVYSLYQHLKLATIHSDLSHHRHRFQWSAQGHPVDCTSMHFHVLSSKHFMKCAVHSYPSSEQCP